MNKPKNVTVIGVCGPSASGKTELSNRLNIHFKAPYEVISMDRFQDCNSAFHEAKTNEQLASELNHEKYGINWEHPTLYSAPALLQYLERLFTKHKKDDHCFIFIEGFLLYYYEELLPLFDIKIFMDGSTEVFMQRRITRERNSCDKEYWEELVWPEFKKRREVMIRHADFVINSDQTLEQVVDQAIRSVEDYCMLYNIDIYGPMLTGDNDKMCKIG